MNGQVSEQKARMLRGEPFCFVDPEILADFERCQDLLSALAAAAPAERQPILTELLDKVGEGTTVRPPFTCDFGYMITIGSGSVLNSGTTIVDCGRVSIGDEVAVAPNVQLLAATHPLDRHGRAHGMNGKPTTIGSPITICDGVWLGAGVIVCPGVTIGEETVVAPGSVVTKDLPARVFAAGNPARVIRNL